MVEEKTVKGVHGAIITLLTSLSLGWIPIQEASTMIHPNVKVTWDLGVGLVKLL